MARSAGPTGSRDWVAARLRCLREARRLVGADDAEDAAQEALVRAWSRRGSCRSADAFPAWVARIAINEGMRLAERRSRRHGREQLTPDVEDGHVRVEEDRALRIDVERALDSLEEDERRLIRMRYFEDLTQTEIAVRLGIPEGTVKVRLHRGRARLRTLLEA